jgi:hypothetical protein
MGLHDEAKLDSKFTDFARQMNLYLNHFPKHEKYGLALEIRRAAYDVYSFIVEAQKRYHKKTAITNLDVRHEQLRMLLRLTLSRSTLARVTRGINFVGFRTWASKRFIRRHSIYTLRASAKRGKLDSVISVLGHARKTHSLQHLLRYLKGNHYALYRLLPKVYHPTSHPRTRYA